MKKIKVYTLAELPEETQKEIYERWANVQYLEYPSEANDSLKAFCDLFYSYVKIRDTDNYIIPDDLENLKGLRLSRWLFNNLNKEITKGKYYSLWSKIDQNPHWTKGGSAPKGKLKSRYSKILKTRDCPLTGWWTDHPLLEPIYKQMDLPSPHCDLDDILKEAFGNLERAVEKDMEYQTSWENFVDSTIDNFYTKDGIEV